MNSFSNEFDSIEKLIYDEGLKINALHFHPDLDLMLIVLSNRKVLNRTISSSPRLVRATPDQLQNYRLIGKGAGVHWPEVDEDLSLKSFLKEEVEQSLREIKSTKLA